MRGRLLGAVLAAAALLLAGCTSTIKAEAGSAAMSFVGTPTSSPSAPAETSTSVASSSTAIPTGDRADSNRMIYGLLTDSDQMGLTASYIGGACDGPARLAVMESATRIDLAVEVSADPNGPEFCPALGIGRTVAARLARPIGDRTIFSRSVRQLPFDGSRRQLPTALPANFVKGVEEFGSEPATDPTLPTKTSSSSGANRDAANSTTRWTVTYHQPQPPKNVCTPTRGIVQVHLGPAGSEAFTSGWIATTVVSIAGHQARLWRAGDPGAPTGWAYVWAADRGTVEVVALTGCQRDRILDPLELLAVAQSLKPS